MERKGNIGINSIITKATINFYKNTTRIKTGSKLMEKFKTTKGLRQGCCRSPTLLKIYSERTLQGCQSKCRNMGLYMGDDML
jgi:hypothetical protein